MKRIFLVVFFTFIFLTGCVPSRYAVQVEMRYPSKSGIELFGKNVSVVYVTDGTASGDRFSKSLAHSFAKELETDYGTGEGSVGVYNIKHLGGSYSQKDTLVNILMDTGSDVVFLFDRMTTTPAGDKMSRFNIRLYCFDGMDKSEKVHTFVGNTISGHATDVLESEAVKSGSIISESFKSQWKHEQYSILYYENDKWYDALMKADTYNWKAALDVWMKLLPANDPYRRSCAEYNIAVACYMLGDYELASQWLDRSDQDNLLSVSDALRKRINTRKSAH